MYVKDQRRADQVGEEINNIEIGGYFVVIVMIVLDLEWGTVDTKRDGSGWYISARYIHSCCSLMLVEPCLRNL